MPEDKNSQAQSDKPKETPVGNSQTKPNPNIKPPEYQHIAEGYDPTTSIFKKAKQEHNN